MVSPFYMLGTGLQEYLCPHGLSHAPFSDGETDAYMNAVIFPAIPGGRNKSSVSEASFRPLLDAGYCRLGGSRPVPQGQSTRGDR